MSEMDAATTETAIQTITRGPEVLDEIWALQEHLHSLEKEIKRVKEQKDYLIELARREGHCEHGKYYLHETVRHLMTIDAEAFRRRYPDKFVKCVTVSIEKARKAVGEDNFKDIATVREMTSYSVKYDAEIMKEKFGRS